MEVVEAVKAVGDQISVVSLLLFIIIFGARYYVQREKEHKEEINEWKKALEAKDEEVRALQEKIEERVLSHSDRMREDLYKVISSQMEASATIRELMNKIENLVVIIKSKN